MHDSNYQKIIDSSSSRRTANILKLFEYLETSPIIDTGKTASALGISYNTVSSAIEALQKMEILDENPKTGRGRTYSYDTHLQILRKDT